MNKLEEEEKFDYKTVYSQTKYYEKMNVLYIDLFRLILIYSDLFHL